MHKDRGGKLTAGPVWDFDYSTFKPSIPKNLIVSSSLWFDALKKDPVFIARVKERWAMYKGDLEQIDPYIDRRAAQIKASAEMNNRKWPNKKYNYVNEDSKLSFTEAVERMKQAYRQRWTVVDNAIKNL